MPLSHTLTVLASNAPSRLDFQSLSHTVVTIKITLSTHSHTQVASHAMLLFSYMYVRYKAQRANRLFSLCSLHIFIFVHRLSPQNLILAGISLVRALSVFMHPIYPSVLHFVLLLISPLLPYYTIHTLTTISVTTSKNPYAFSRSPSIHSFIHSPRQWQQPRTSPP